MWRRVPPSPKRVWLCSHQVPLTSAWSLPMVISPRTTEFHRHRPRNLPQHQLPSTSSGSQAHHHCLRHSPMLHKINSEALPFRFSPLRRCFTIGHAGTALVRYGKMPSAYVLASMHKMGCHHVQDRQGPEAALFGVSWEESAPTVLQSGGSALASASI